MDDMSVLRAIIDSGPTCTVVTQGRNGDLRARTMTRLNSLEQGHIDFPTLLTSGKVEDVRADPRVTLFFVDPRSRDTATLYGTGAVIVDPQQKERCWKESLRYRWPQGHTDPSFVVLRVTLTHGEYLIAATEVYGKVQLGA